MTGYRVGFGNDKPLWKQRRGHLLQFPDHKATKKKNSGKNLGKTKEKERAKNQTVTITSLLLESMCMHLSIACNMPPFVLFHGN